MKLFSKIILSISFITSLPVMGAVTGQTLYQTNCAGCHGVSPVTGLFRIGAGYTNSSTSYNTSVISSAITNYPVMGGLTNLSPTDINNIASFIHADISSGGTLTPIQPLTPLENGKNLYTTMCSSCHGDATLGHHDLAKGYNAPTIQAAINKVAAMRYLGYPDQQVLADIGLYVSTVAKGESGEGSGCTIGQSSNPFDPLWFLMIGLSVGILSVRYKKSA